MSSDKYIIIGSRPYFNFNFNELIDSFGGNCRCNLALPNNNNGTIRDEHIFNCHTYANLIKSSRSVEWLLEFYKKLRIPREHLEKFKKTFRAEEYSKIFTQDMFNSCVVNQFLSHINCPYVLKKQPRVGFNILFKKLIKNFPLQGDPSKQKIYLTGWTITIDLDESVKNFYRPKKMNSCAKFVHDTLAECKILIWLHDNNYIDASLCVLEDKTSPTINCDLIMPTDFIINLILEKCGNCLLAKT